MGLCTLFKKNFWKFLIRVSVVFLSSVSDFPGGVYIFRCNCSGDFSGRWAHSFPAR